MWHSARTSATTMLAVACLTGCAHQGRNQYAYAPPLAPPVYPQPQPPAPAPVPATDGVVAPPMMAATPPMMPGTVTAAPAMPPAAMAQPLAGEPCCPPLDGGVLLDGAGVVDGAALPVVYDAAGQSPPCPPGP